VKGIVLHLPDVVGSWVAAQTGGDWHKGMGQGIGLVDPEHGIVAGVSYVECNGASVLCHIAVKGRMVPEFLDVIFRYPFEDLGCSKLLGLVASSNLQARRLNEHFGFVPEATLKEAHPDGDLIIYTMTRSQCRWLNLREKRRGKVQRTQDPELSSPGPRRGRAESAHGRLQHQPQPG
jgi:hypothetical protein